METEPLLKLHRKFSTKEKLGLAQQRNNVLLSENAKLKKRVEELEKMILPKPYKKQDKEVISYQAYLRLKRKQIVNAVTFGNRQEVYDATETLGEKYYKKTFKP